MGMQVGGKKGGPMADINVTPLVDVVLVLLIIFMVTTTAVVGWASRKRKTTNSGSQGTIQAGRETARLFVVPGKG